MPYCPKCKYEYRPEISKCPDCDSKLVDQLSEEEQDGSQKLVCVATYLNHSDAQLARLKLDSQNIWSTIINETMSNIDLRAVWADRGIMLCVRENDLPAARKVLEE